MARIDYGYRRNEWVALYVDENGDVQVLTFDTYKQATGFLECCTCKIGVVTTAMYNAYLSKHYEKE